MVAGGFVSHRLRGISVVWSRNPIWGIGIDNFRILIDRNDSSRCFGAVEVSGDALRDYVDDGLAVQGYERGCMEGNRVRDLLKSLFAPLRLVLLGVGSDEFTGGIGAVDLERLVV